MKSFITLLDQGGNLILSLMTEIDPLRKMRRVVDEDNKVMYFFMLDKTDYLENSDLPSARVLVLSGASNSAWAISGVSTRNKRSEYELAIMEIKEDASPISASTDNQHEVNTNYVRDLQLYSFLIFNNALNINHKAKTLYDHLLGTKNILESWGCSNTLQRAGLLHSVFGTATFRRSTRSIEYISQLEQLTGKDVARLVKLYAYSERGYHMLDALETECMIINQGGRYGQSIEQVTRDEIINVITIDCANLIEQHADSDFLRHLLYMDKMGQLELPISVKSGIGRYFFNY